MNYQGDLVIINLEDIIEFGKETQHYIITDNYSDLSKIGIDHYVARDTFSKGMIHLVIDGNSDKDIVAELITLKHDMWYEKNKIRRLRHMVKFNDNLKKCKILGRVKCNSGHIGVFSLDEVNRYNTLFKYRLTNMKYSMCIISNFCGEITGFARGYNTALYGNGNNPFFTICIKEKFLIW